MKIPKGKTIEDAPAVVMAVWISAHYKIPIGTGMYDKAIEEGPEWFPDEVEYRRKRSLVPNEVDEAHEEERMGLYRQFNEWVDSQLTKPEGGLMARIQNMQETKEYLDKKDQLRIEYQYEGKDRAIWYRHYSTYGLQYIGGPLW